MTETVVILSTADYDAAAWTNKQHLATRLAGHLNVIYIESLGLRQPTFALADIRRISRRLLGPSSKRPDSSAESTLRVVKPQVLPFHSLKLVKLVNAKLIHRQIRRLVNIHQSSNVLWTFSPVTYGVEKYFGRVVYHSVDLLHTIPHVPVKLVLESELKLVENADIVIASSSGVQRHLQSLTTKDIELWENVADTKLYAATSSSNRVSRAVFAGNLTGSKIDFSLLHRLAATGIEIILAGPSAIDGTHNSAEIIKLRSSSNVKFAGNLSPVELAQLLNTCTVGLIPYLNNEYTAGVFPMKVYEYLASGLAVVSTQLPSLDKVDDRDIHTVLPTQFVDTVLGALAWDDALIAERRKRASGHSWETRTAQALTIVSKVDENAN